MMKLTSRLNKHEIKLEPDDFPLALSTAVSTASGSTLKTYQIERNPNGSLTFKLVTIHINKKYKLDKKKQNG